VAKRLGSRQTEILRVLWRRGEATAREITEEMNRVRETAHSTVQTLLREMEAKGVVAHRLEERTFYFFPTVAEDEIASFATRDLLRRLFEDSPLRLITHLLDTEKLSDDDMRRLRRLVEERAADAATAHPEEEL